VGFYKITVVARVKDAPGPESSIIDHKSSALTFESWQSQRRRARKTLKFHPGSFLPAMLSIKFGSGHPYFHYLLLEYSYNIRVFLQKNENSWIEPGKSACSTRHFFQVSSH
jgi:hypothetical protein